MEYTLDILLHLILSPSLVAYPDFDQSFILHTDASVQGLSCAVYQQQNVQLRILDFGSRTLVGTESKKHSSKL